MSRPEPPRDPAEYPDMDAIRAAADAPRPRETPHLDGGSEAIERFLRSMVIDYEKWHDGIGYDLDALGDASADERRHAESRLVPPNGWRDVEALAALADLGSTAAVAALRRALASGSTEVRLAVMRYAPHLVEGDARTAALVRALDTAAAFDGLSATLDQVEAFHPAPVIDALWRGLLARDGEVAVHYAAMLAFLYGKAESSFDWALRPLFLEFNTAGDAERRAALEKLRALLAGAAP